MDSNNYWSYVSLKVERMGVIGDSAETSQRVYLDNFEINKLSGQRKRFSFPSRYEESLELKLRNLIQDLGLDGWELITDQYFLEGSVIQLRFLTFKKIYPLEIVGNIKAREFLRKGEKLKALHAYRGVTDVGLAEAKSHIDHLDSLSSDAFDDWISEELRSKYLDS